MDMIELDVDAIAADVLAAVNAYGVSLTLVKPVKGALVDETKAWGDRAPGTDLEVGAQGVEDKFRLDQIDGKKVMQGDQIVWVSLDSIADEGQRDLVEQFKFVDVGSERWGVQGVHDKAKLGDRLILVAYHVRKMGARAVPEVDP